MKHAKVKLSAISTTEPSEPLFIPYLPENNDIKLAKIKKSIRELKKGIREYTKSEEYRKSKDGKKTIVDIRFCYKKLYTAMQNL